MKRYLPISIWLVALLIVAGALLFFEADLLWKVQEQNLFLDTRMFFNERMLVPGGLLSWTGTWLTQFFYHPWVGILLLCACWLLLMWLVKKAFALTDVWMPLALVPVGLLLLTIVDMGYWVYLLKLPGHVFVGTLGTIAVAALLWVFRLLPQRYGLRLVFIGVTVFVGYPLLGIYGIAATLLMGLYIWRQKVAVERKQSGARSSSVEREQTRPKAKITGSLLALAGAAVVPLLCYHYAYHETNLANIYYAALPLYYLTEEYHAYYLPFYGLALFFVMMILLRLDKKQVDWSSLRRKGGKIKLPTSLILQALVLGVLVWAVATYWYKDENFHHELRMQRCIEQNDWQGVVAEAALQKDEPTRAIVMMRNLALSRLGRQADEMYLYPNGSKRYEAPFDMRLMMCVGPMIYYQYGLINSSERLSTEMGVEFGWRVADLKLLAKCALLNKQESRARKFLNLLKHTTFFGDWADQAREMDELKTVARMMHYPNKLGSDDGYTERFVMRRLAECTNTDDPMFQEQTLLATLWTKDIQQFWFHFGDYVKLHPNSRMPRYFQEAAYLYGMVQEQQTVLQMPFDQMIKLSFDNFMNAAQRYEGATPEVGREGLKAFSDTYYYDYYLMKNLPEY